MLWLASHVEDLIGRSEIDGWVQRKQEGEPFVIFDHVTIADISIYEILNQPFSYIFQPSITDIFKKIFNQFSEKYYCLIMKFILNYFPLQSV